MNVNKLIFFGLVFIAFLPLVQIAPWFSPPSWTNTIALKAVMSGLFLLFLWGALFGRGMYLPSITKETKKILVALGALLSVFFISGILSLDPTFSFWGDPFRSWGVVNYLFYGLFSVFLFLFVREEKEWRIVWWTAAAVGVGTVLVALIQISGSFSDVIIAQLNRPGSVFGNPLLIGTFLSTLIFALLPFALSVKKKIARSILFAILSFFLLGILVSVSRSAFIALVAGGLFFLWAFPKKSTLVKGGAVALVVVFVIIIAFANTIPKPAFIENQSLLSGTWGSLSLQKALGENRIEAWQIVSRATLDRPILGYGPYNTSIAFDKYFDSKGTIPSTGEDSWWSTSHNIFLDIAVGTGYVGLAVFLWFIGSLFWVLSQVKRRVPEYRIHAHGMQAAFVAYFASTFFALNMFPTYILFFLIVGYTLYLSSKIPEEGADTQGRINEVLRKLVPYRTPLFAAALVAVMIFSWQYVIQPYRVQVNVETAKIFSLEGRCQEAVRYMERGLQVGDTFLNASVRREYNNILIECKDDLSQTQEETILRQYTILREATLARPHFTRTWLSFARVAKELLGYEEGEERDEIEREMFEALERMRELNPRRGEINELWAAAALQVGRYKEAKEQSVICLERDPTVSSCHLARIASVASLGDFEAAEEFFMDAERQGVQFKKDTSSLEILVDAYIINDTFHPRLAWTYEQLIALEQENTAHYASLAFVYRELGEYEKAREWAMKILEIDSSAKRDVEAFLSTLP